MAGKIFIVFCSILFVQVAFADDSTAELPKILLDEVRANADVILKEVRSKMMENLDIVANETLKSISLVESLVGAIELETGGALKELLSALDVQPAKNNAAGVLTETDLASQVDEIKKSAQNLILGIIKVLVKQMHENKTNKMQHQLVNEKVV